MHEVKVRDIPARSLLCLLRHASSQQEVWAMGKEVIGMLKAQPVPVPRIEGVAGAAFLIYYGEVNQDSDGPVEFCWPVPQDLARASSPPASPRSRCALSLRTRRRAFTWTRTLRRRSGKPPGTPPWPGRPGSSGSPVTWACALRS